MVSSKKKVCVVGAGVSGLASARELLREGHDVIDGHGAERWRRRAVAVRREDGRRRAGDPLGTAGAHSSIYASVRVIDPRELMAFSDFPFFPKNDGTGDGRRYPGHAEFLRYIRDFCDAFGLMDAVRLNTKVLHVAPLAEEYHRAREMAGVPRHLSHAIFFDLDYCDEFGEKHCGFPRPPEWKRELMRTAVALLRDGDVERYRDSYSYHDDSDIVLEGLRSEGAGCLGQDKEVDRPR